MLCRSRWACAQKSMQAVTPEKGRPGLNPKRHSLASRSNWVWLLKASGARLRYKGDKSVARTCILSSISCSCETIHSLIMCNRFSSRLDCFQDIYLRSYGQSKLSDSFTSGILASVVIHWPGAAKGKASATSVRIESLARTSSWFVGTASSGSWKTESIEFVT